MRERDSAELAVLLRITVLLGGSMLIMGGATLVFIARRHNAPGWVLLLLALLLIPITWGLILLVEQATARSSRGLITALHAGYAEPRKAGFSRQEALVAQGRLEDAAVAYRLHLADHPQDVAALVALGRLLGGLLADPDGAATAYRAARRLAPGGDWDRIIADDLIDLYGRTNQMGKLQVELARFAETCRGTNAGAAALARLRESKQRGE